MKTRAKVAFSAVVLLGTVPLLASSCQEAYGAAAAASGAHFDILTMTIPPAAPNESPKDTFRLTAGPAKRSLQVVVEARFGGADRLPEFCTIDIGGRVDISFAADGNKFVGTVPTPTSYGAGKTARGSLSCSLGGLPVVDNYTISIVK